jgi:hypothetical protein
MRKRSHTGQEGKFVKFLTRVLEIQHDDEWSKTSQTSPVVSPSSPVLRGKTGRKVVAEVKGLEGLMGL